MSTKDYKNPLMCPICTEYQYLVFKKMRFTEDDNGIEYNLPFFRCDNCNKDTTVISEEKIDEMARNHFFEIKNLNMSGFYSLHIIGEDERFENYPIENLDYDARDYYFVPGLKRPWDDGLLTPVFFTKDLLLHYNNHPEYSVDLQSFSNVVIYKGDEALLPYGFGINRNRKLFAWLGDLYPFLSNPNNKEHLYRFLAANVSSDHDLFSDYYLMQIEARVVESDNEIQIFRLKKRFEDLISEKFNFKIFNFNIDDLKNDYKSPIMNEKTQVFSAFEELSNLIIENINKIDLKDNLKDVVDSKDLNDKGGLKLLELFFEHKLKLIDSHGVISPLFVLYDLRNLKAHLTVSSFDKKYGSCAERLGVDSSVNFIDLFEEVVTSIIEMFSTLNKGLVDI